MVGSFLRNFLYSGCMVWLTFVYSTAQSTDSFEQDVLRYSQILQLPGLAIGVAWGDSLVYFKGIGNAHPGKEEPLSPDHIFVIASLTKSFASVALHQMQEEKKLSLNDRVADYPNKFFTPNRWDQNTTLAHIISHTSESNPIGTNFIYNGGKYNLVYNAFCKLNGLNVDDGTNLPFAAEIEARIIQPLKLSHTITRKNQPGIDQLLSWIITPYQYNSTSKTFDPRPIDMTFMQSGPAYGMMSSVRDLVTYSSGIVRKNIINKESYRSMTTPFYKNSPQGKGWFVTNYEGWDLHWAYGYGNTDAAILLKVPAKNLTLVVLSSITLPSETTRLGFGNPLNSPVVCSFMRNFVLNQKGSILIDSDSAKWQRQLKPLTQKSGSRIFIEETFAASEIRIFSPESLIPGAKDQGTHLLKMLAKTFPNDKIWYNPAAFELIAHTGDPQLLKFGHTKCEGLNKINSVHPALVFFAGKIEEKSGQMDKAVSFYEKLSEGDYYREQSYKHNAMMILAKHYLTVNPGKAKSYLERLIHYKDYISQQDDQYREAKKILENLRP